MIIAPETEGKGRSFTAFLVATVTADHLWEGGMTSTDVERPVWALVASSEAEIRPFMANLRMGKKAIFGNGERSYRRGKGEKIEFLKSAKYSVFQQRTPYGVAQTLYLHDLFTLDPGMVDPEGLKFVMMVPAEEAVAAPWDRQAAIAHVAKVNKLDLEAVQGPPAKVVDLAPYFAAFVDRRTRQPLVCDTRFYFQLMVACLEKGLASLPSAGTSHWGSREWGANMTSFQVDGLGGLGYATPLAFKASHEDFEAIMAEEATKFFAATGVETFQGEP